MSDKTFILTVVTPERRVFQETVNMVIVRTTDGEMGVLPGHIPLVAPLAIGPLRIKTGDDERKAAVNGGFIEVTAQQVIILSESAEMEEEIDVARAESARQRALARLEKRQADVDYARAQAALQRAIIRLKVAGHEG
ncbi:MAG: F0F1 ATP synthase subunit epsilon [Eubacteriales bacterium]|nr:F0F1 ATP synthase subunit epsilon [Eubacteriales bacterium]MDD4078149.1 F0F1 ATP synthase subunit epsilon [Eubacteriales bacterium]MDD4768436.1 F0F1 ATP synthase subunit epsilon [Eubacteriales bacterium]